MSPKSQPFCTFIEELSRRENKQAGNIFPFFFLRAQCLGKGWEEGRYFQTSSQMLSEALAKRQLCHTST